VGVGVLVGSGVGEDVAVGSGVGVFTKGSESPQPPKRIANRMRGNRIRTGENLRMVFLEDARAGD
jgi:hypothetical protein